MKEYIVLIISSLRVQVYRIGLWGYGCLHSSRKSSATYSYHAVRDVLVFTYREFNGEYINFAKTVGGNSTYTSSISNCRVHFSVRGQKQTSPTWFVLLSSFEGLDIQSGCSP